MITDSQTPDPVAVNLITGFLGSGKTSAILSLLPQRPPHERWAVLVNEYGMVSLDHILLNDGVDREGVVPLDVRGAETSQNGDAARVTIDEMAGGCFCCTLSDSLPLMLKRLIRQARPHRLLIEPTGAGHPAAVIDLLRNGNFGTPLDLRATVCLIDPRDYENPRITNQNVFRDQIQMADVVAINFTDKCPQEQVDRCREFILQQDPPKILVEDTCRGFLKAQWLDLKDMVVRAAKFPHLHAQGAQNHTSNPVDLQLPDPEHSDAPQLPMEPGQRQAIPGQRREGKPHRYVNTGLGQAGCGWIFHPDDTFDRSRLTAAISSIPNLIRIKGVFHCSDDWWEIQGQAEDQELQRSAYRTDSRVEMLTAAVNPNWDDIEQQLLGCLHTATPW